MKNKVVLFEIPASDLKKAKDFYETVFDWKVDLWHDEGAMAVTTAVDKDQHPIEPGGINGGFYKRKSKDDHPSFGVQTASIDKTLTAIEKAGGKVVTPKTFNRRVGFYGGLCRSGGQRDRSLGKAGEINLRFGEKERPLCDSCSL